ncbi:hypothetical protein B296_00033951, partial [Ensete ventricosum]
HYGLNLGYLPNKALVVKRSKPTFILGSIGETKSPRKQRRVPKLRLIGEEMTSTAPPGNTGRGVQVRRRAIVLLLSEVGARGQWGAANSHHAIGLLEGYQFA